MKILAVFLGLVFLFPPAVILAQNDQDCGFPPALKTFTVERIVRVESGPPLEIVSPQIVERLEDGQNCLEDHLKKLQDKVDGPVLGLETRVKFLQMVNESLTSQIDDLQSQLRAAKLDLHIAETKIEMLESTLKSDEHMTEAMFSLFARAGKSKPAVNPAGKPESGTGSTKTPASKPKAPVNKPKPTADSGKDR